MINKIKDPLVIAAYSADPWESALPVLRYIGACQLAGIKVVVGNQGPSVDQDRVNDADLVVIQRDFPRFVSGYAQVMQRARQQNKPVLYEIDDLLFELPKGHLAHPDLSELLNPMLWAAVEATAVTTTTPVLYDYLQPFNPNIWLLPNYLDDSLWEFQPPRSSTDNAPVILGYMGGKTHYSDLTSILPALQTLLARYEGHLTIKFWGGPPPEELVNHPAVFCTPLDMLDYAAFTRYFVTQQSDIFIAPLADNDFNRAKSAIKFLEYGTLGVAGVYSNLIPYQGIVEHGKNGFLAGSVDEWVHYISVLVENSVLRHEMALAAQQTVRQSWLLSKHAVQWVTVYQAALNTPGRMSEGQPQRLKVLQRIDQQVFDRFQELHIGLAREEQAVQVLRNELAAAQLEIATVRFDLAVAKNETAAVREELAAIKQSRTWRLIQKLGQVRIGVAPVGSLREKLLRKLRIIS